MGQFFATLTDNGSIFVTAFLNTVKLFLAGGVGALVLGTILAAMRVSPAAPLRAFGAAYVTLLRNTPLTLVFVFAAFGLPKLEIDLSYFTFAVIALTVYTASFVCEAVRSGINTVPPGQAEASRAVGMTFGQGLTNIVLPQAFRSVAPPLFSVFIALLKNTTIAAGFSVTEAGAIRANLSERGEDALYVLLWVALIFIALVLPLAAIQRRLERSWKVA